MAYFRIKEAAEKVGVMPHVLRFWESQFPHLKPSKTGRGQRLYEDLDIKNFLKIKHLLYTEGYSIPGAKKFLKEEKTGGRAAAAAEQSVQRSLLLDIRDEIKKLEELVKEI